MEPVAVTNPQEGPVRYRRLPSVERSLAGGRRFVQPLHVETPTQLSGSAPIIWDLLAEHATVAEIVEILQERFSDAPSAIAGGVVAAIDSFLTAELVRECRDS